MTAFRFFPVASMLLYLFLFVGSPASAQEDRQGPTIICWQNTYTEEESIPPTAAFVEGEAQVLSSFVLDLSAEVPQEAIPPIEFAAAIWETRLSSVVPIRVEVFWEDQGNENILASAGPTTVFRDFAEAPFGRTWYPVALAESLTGRNLNDNDPDITVRINSEANWYFGTDGRVPFNQIDLASVLLHELGHGLGFLASSDTLLTTDTLLGSLGLADFPLIYDRFLESQSGLTLIDETLFSNPSVELFSEFTSDDLFFGSDLTTDLNGGLRVVLFAPSVFDPGSSISHLDEFTYPAGSENALMTPRISRRESTHDPGPLTLGVMAAMGWEAQFEVTSTREQVVGRLKVFPNPAREALFVEWPETVLGASQVELRITDVNGASVFHRQLAADRQSIALPVLPAGYYTLSLRHEGQLYVTPLTIVP